MTPLSQENTGFIRALLDQSIQTASGGRPEDLTLLLQRFQLVPQQATAEEQRAALTDLVLAAAELIAMFPGCYEQAANWVFVTILLREEIRPLTRAEQQRIVTQLPDIKDFLATTAIASGQHKLLSLLDLLDRDLMANNEAFLGSLNDATIRTAVAGLLGIVEKISSHSLSVETAYPCSLELLLKDIAVALHQYNQEMVRTF